jgi:hypothetical protein
VPVQVSLPAQAGPAPERQGPAAALGQASDLSERLHDAPNANTRALFDTFNRRSGTVSDRPSVSATLTEGHLRGLRAP